MTSNADLPPKSDVYLATTIEKKIGSYRKHMPETERQTFARNLGTLLTSAKSSGIKKSAIVVASGVPHFPEAPANSLNAYCILSDGKSKRAAKTRLCASPAPYLKLALAAANLMNMARHDAILKLTEGSNYFSAEDEIDESAFSPAQAVWELLKAKLAVIVERHQLKQYFREAYSVSASFGESLFNSGVWEQDTSCSPSTSYWPSVYLFTISHSSARARCTIVETKSDIEGVVHSVESVFLTLGWNPKGWVVGYLEILPGLAVQSYERGDHTPLYNFRCSGETLTEGRVRGISFSIENGGFIKVSDSPGNWPYRLRSRVRFESLSPRNLASTLLESQVIYTTDAIVVPEIDTASVLSPPDSPLALLEAQLYRRPPTWPKRSTQYFLDKLEEEIIDMTSSFREWRKSQSDLARRDYFSELEAATLELNSLKGQS
ncbi:hypothetical protein [Pseudomonas sp. TMB3-21]